MTDISHTLVAKSDQLNAADIIGTEKLLTITKVDVKQGGDQPVTIHYEGENGRPWRPCLTARRILARLWGTDSSKWIGHTVAVHNDASVVYAGEEVGGIRPCAATGIESLQIIKLKEKRSPKPKTFEIKPLRLAKTQSAQSAPRVVEFSMDNYERAIDKIIATSKTADELEERFDRMQDWRKQAAETDRDRTKQLRERYDEALERLSSADG